MSYYTRRRQILLPHQVFKGSPDQPRIPAGQPGGGQWAPSGGGGGGGGRAIRHHPIQYDRETYGVERVEELGGEKPRMSHGRIEEEFPSMEAARAHAEGLNRGEIPMQTAIHQDKIRAKNRAMAEYRIGQARAAWDPLPELKERERVNTITDMRNRARAGDKDMQEMLARARRNK